MRSREMVACGHWSTEQATYTTVLSVSAVFLTCISDILPVGCMPKMSCSQQASTEGGTAARTCRAHDNLGSSGIQSCGLGGDVRGRALCCRYTTANDVSMCPPEVGSSMKMMAGFAAFSAAKRA